jgi:hypothetical protein
MKSLIKRKKVQKESSRKPVAQCCAKKSNAAAGCHD